MPTAPAPVLPHADFTSDEPVALPGSQPLNSLAAKLTSDVMAKFRSLRPEGAEGADGDAAPAVVHPAEPAAVPMGAAQPAAPAAVPAVAQPTAQPATALPDPSDDPSIPAHERPPTGAAKATKEDWMRFRSLMKSQVEAERKGRETAEREAEALRKSLKGIPAEEHERLKAEKAELEAEVERTALERSPRFRNYYEGGIAKQLRLVKAAAGKHGDEVVKLLAQPSSPERNSRLSELKTELGIDGDIIGQAAAAIRQLTLERDEQLASHSENLKALRLREGAEAAEAAQRTSTRRAALAESLATRAGSLPEFKADPADAAHVTFATEAISFIRDATLGKLAEADAALLPIAAMKAQYYESIEKPKLVAELTALRARVGQLTGATPRVEGQQRVGGNPTGGATPRTALNSSNFDPMKAVKEITDKFNELRGGAGT